MHCSETGSFLFIIQYQIGGHQRLPNREGYNQFHLGVHPLAAK